MPWGIGTRKEGLCESLIFPITQTLALIGTTFNLDRTYADNGTFTVTGVITDDDGAVGNDTVQVTVNNVTPTVSTPTVLPTPSNEGGSVAAGAAPSGARRTVRPCA